MTAGSSQPNGGVFVALGSNLGDRDATLRSALASLDRVDRTRVIACSTFHDTAPVGGPPGQGRFLNAVASLDTRLPPLALLDAMQRIERDHDRVRTERNGPRTLDLDLLTYGPLRCRTDRLTLPHPRMFERAFVLLPLAELCDVEALRATLTAGDALTALA